MGSQKIVTHIGMVFVLVFLFAGMAAAETSGQGQIREMTLRGQIGKVPNGYVVRGTNKTVIFTVLNPEPAVLDKLVEAGKEVQVKVRIVSGDNVNIETIDGRPYPSGRTGKEEQKGKKEMP